jgi:hypothetical protein
MPFRYVEVLSYSFLLEDMLVLMHRLPGLVHLFQCLLAMDLKLSEANEIKCRPHYPQNLLVDCPRKHPQDHLLHILIFISCPL